MRQFFLLIAACGATWAYSVQMQFGNYPSGVNGAYTGNVYVSPYYGTMDGQPVTLFCVDYIHDVNFGQQWLAELTPLSDHPGVAQSTRWGAITGAQQKYREAAWLLSQFGTHNTPADYVALQVAIWGIFTPSYVTPLVTSSSNAWLAQAQANSSQVDERQFALLTDAPGDNGWVQEFMIRDTNGFRIETATPEPGTWMLMGTAALTLAGACWRRRRSASATESSVPEM